MEKKQFDENESLKTIQAMIESAKAEMKDDGFFYLLWGYLVFIASLSNFFLLYNLHPSKAALVWSVIMSAGWIFTIIRVIRKEKRITVRTHVHKVMSYLWGGFTISLILVLFMTLQKHHDLLNPIIILLYAMATFVSGGVLKFRPLIIGGIIAWCFAIASFYAEANIQLLLVAISVLIAYIIPGHILKKTINSNSH